MMKLTILVLLFAVAHAQTGSFVAQPVVTADALEIANWAASSMTSSLAQTHSVLAVKNLRTQVVAGINYRFTLELLVDSQVTKSCEMDIFDQSWTNTRKFNAEPVCTVVQSNMGGYVPKPVNDEVLSLARWAAAEFTTGVHTVVSVSNYRTQIVAGVNHKFTLELLVDGKVSKTCEMSIFTQSWTNTIKYFEEPKCNAARVGGFVDSEVTEKVKEIAAWSARALSTGEETHSVVEIKNVQTQLVSGMNYKFTLVLSVNGVITKSCDLNVFDQVWTGVRKFNEEPKCKAATLVGGYVPQTEISAEAMEVAKWASSELAALANANNINASKFPILHSVKTIKNLRTQVVNGINYKFTLELMVSQPPSNAIWTKSCELTVNVQSWLNQKTFVEEPKC